MPEKVGKGLSVKFAPLIETEDVLLNVMVSVEVPPGGIVPGEKDFEILTREAGSTI